MRSFLEKLAKVQGAVTILQLLEKWQAAAMVELKRCTPPQTSYSFSNNKLCDKRFLWKFTGLQDIVFVGLYYRVFDWLCRLLNAGWVKFRMFSKVFLNIRPSFIKHRLHWRHFTRNLQLKIAVEFKCTSSPKFSIESSGIVVEPNSWTLMVKNLLSNHSPSHFKRCTYKSQKKSN